MHSLKDLPTAPADGIALAAVPLREDPRDVVVARDGLTLGELPVGSRVGTGSPRRAAQLHALGLGLDVLADPRQRRHPDRQGAPPASSTPSCSPAPAWPGWAGSTRSPRSSTRCRCCPPPARARWPSSAAPTTTVLGTALAALDDPATRAAVTAERRVLADLEAGCSAPVGALAEVVEGEDGEELWLRAVALSLDGPSRSVGPATGPPDAAEDLGRPWPPRCWPRAPPTSTHRHPRRNRPPRLRGVGAMTRPTRRSGDPGSPTPTGTTAQTHTARTRSRRQT